MKVKAMISMSCTNYRLVYLFVLGYSSGRENSLYRHVSLIIGNDYPALRLICIDEIPVTVVHKEIAPLRRLFFDMSLRIILPNSRKI